MQRIIPLFCIISIFSAKILFAGSPAQVKNFINHKDWSFVENKGQLTDEKGNQLPDIKYYSHDGGAHLYCRPGMINFVFTKVEPDKNSNISEATGGPAPYPLKGAHSSDYAASKVFLASAKSPLRYGPSKITTDRIDLVLVGANPTAQIIATDKQEYYENYFTTGDADHGITNVHTFKTVIYHNIYAQIDMILHATESGMEYSFLVHPGGNYNDIRMRWNGIEKKEISGNIKYSASLGCIKESAPKSFVDERLLKSNFRHFDDGYGFEVENYNHGKEMVIDPILNWSTYYGGSGDEYSDGVCLDSKSNVYITGNATSPGLASSGAYQTSTVGSNAFIAKFNSSGARLWCTYYGYDGVYVGNGICPDTSGGVYFTCNSNGNSGLATSGAYRTSNAGSADAILANFSATGGLNWATYYGGSNREEGVAISSDDSGHVYLMGATYSSSGIATAGAYQTAYGGSESAFLAVFTASGGLNWATYFTGNNDIYPSGVSNDANGNIYITGSTIIGKDLATTGAYQTSYMGSEDAYLAKFTKTGSLAWATYFGGTRPDGGNAVINDKYGNVFIAGSTYSIDHIATPDAYQENGEAKNGDVFLAKFTTGGSLAWATYFGGLSQDAAYTLCTDTAANIFIAGITLSTSGIATPGQYQTTYGGSGGNGYIAKFSNTGNRSFATYFGGKGTDYITNICIDASGNIYAAGQTETSINLATSGAYQTSNGGGFDAFLARFNFNTYPNDAGIDNNSRYNSVCDGAEPVKVILQNYGTSILKNVKIGWSINGITKTTYTWTGSVTPSNSTVITLDSLSLKPGTYPLKVWTSMPNGVNDSFPANDTSIMTYVVNGLPAAKTIKDTAICYGGSLSIGAVPDSGSIYQWTSMPAGFSDSVANPIVKPLINTAYSLKETSAAGCITINSVKINVNVVPVASFTIKDSIQCQGNNSFDFTDYSTVSSGSISGWSWDFGDSTKSVSENPVHVYKTGGNFRVKQTVTSKAGCPDTISKTVTVYAQPVSSFSINNAAQCLLNNSFIFTDNSTISSGSIKTWFWDFGDASNTYLKTPKKHSYVNPGVDTVKLTVTSNNGCITTSAVPVSVYAVPAAVMGGYITICNGQSVTLGPSVISGESYAWASRPKGYSAGTASITVSPDTTTTYILTEKINATGCSRQDSEYIQVLVSPTPKITGTDTVCIGSTAGFQTKKVVGDSYAWYAGYGTIISGSNSTQVNIQWTTPGTDTVKVVESNLGGCIDSSILIVTIDSLPLAITGKAANICDGQKITLGAPSKSGHIYSWVSTPAGFSSSVSDPAVMPGSTTTYTLTETNKSGCTNSVSVKITVNPLPAAYIIHDTSICHGTTISIGGSAVAGSTYSWESSPSGYTSNIANPTIIAVDSIYILTETNSHACSKTDSVRLHYYSSPVSGISYSNVCPGDSMPFTAKDFTKLSKFSAKAFAWSFGDGGTSALSNPLHLYKTNGAYTVSLIGVNSYGCSDTVSQKITISPCVWPGDANDDKVVNMKDFLYVGVAFGTTGHLRPSASIKWTGQPSPDWDSVFKSGVNYKYADCNGDSIINYKDTIAISANYSFTHPKTSSFSQGSPGDPEFVIKYLKDTVYAGDTLVAQVMIGSSSKPVTDIYGLAFSLGLDPLYYEVGMAYMTLNSSFIGSNGVNMMAMNRNNISSGNFDIGISKTDHLNVSGYGTIATLYVPVVPALPQKLIKTSLPISNNTQIAYNQKNVSFYLTSDSVVLKQTKTGINYADPAASFNLNIFPNPFQSSATITYNLSQSSKINISLLDITGNQICIIVNENQVPGAYQFDINAEKYHLSQGIYVLKFMIGDEVVSRRLVKF